MEKESGTTVEKSKKEKKKKNAPPQKELLLPSRFKNRTSNMRILTRTKQKDSASVAVSTYRETGLKHETLRVHG